jgi:hypothetical protein
MPATGFPAAVNAALVHTQVTWVQGVVATVLVR